MVCVFDDRVEIESTGGLHFGLRAEDLYRNHNARPWNPTMAGVIYRRGIVESIGTGTLRMLRFCREVGNAAPLIEDTGSAVRVSFARPGYSPPLLAGFGLTREQLRAIESIAAGATTRSELVASTGINERLARRILAFLKDSGLISYTGTRSTVRWHLIGPAEASYPQPSAEQMPARNNLVQGGSKPILLYAPVTGV